MQSPSRVASQNAPYPCQNCLKTKRLPKKFKRPLVCLPPTLHSFTSLCRASSLGSQHDAARICCPRPNLCSAANQPHAAVAVDRRDRRTDGRTPDHYIDPTPHTMRVASIKPHHAYAYKSRRLLCLSRIGAIARSVRLSVCPSVCPMAQLL